MGRREELLKKLESEDKVEVREAIESLVEFPDGEVVRAIVNTVLTKRSKTILEAAKSALMSMKGGTSAICEELVRLFEHPEPKLRQASIDILSHRGDECIDVVEKKLLRHEDYNMRKFALDILARVRSEKALDLIISSLKDTNPNVSLTALEYLRDFGGFKDKVVGAILDVLPSLGDLYALTTLASTVIYGNFKDQRLVEPLREKVKHLKDPMERHWVYKTLLFLGDEEVLKDALENAKSIGMEEDIRKDIEIFGLPGGG